VEGAGRKGQALPAAPPIGGRQRDSRVFADAGPVERFVVWAKKVGACPAGRLVQGSSGGQSRRRRGSPRRTCSSGSLRFPTACAAGLRWVEARQSARPG